MTKRVLFLVFVAFAIPLALHCQPHDVEIVDIHGNFDAGDAEELGKPCTKNDECEASEYCGKKSCESPMGRCSRRPSFCTGELTPVCGCDNVTYWNDCMRRMGGVGSTAAEGECASGVRCRDHGATECPTTEASCARVSSNPGPGCPPELGGTCWVVPRTCPAPTGPGVEPIGGAWEECKGGPGSDHCADLCKAIRAERPYKRSPPEACH